MDDKQKKAYNYNRINYLQKVYSTTNKAPGEKVTRKPLDKQRNINLKNRRIDELLTYINNPYTVKEEVHQICTEVDDLKQLCPKCKFEQIVAVIILYVQRIYNNKLIEERTKLWREFDLTWKLYGRIVGRILVLTREKKPLGFPMLQ